MFIKFDDLDMLEFFENEPIFISEKNEAVFMYSTKGENLFSVILTIDTYARKVDISINYSDNIIFSGEFDNVAGIRKSEDVLFIEIEDKRRLVLKKSSVFSLVIENN